jgi:glyoxylase-like metal-dependent hydrolase (beta-lactamase superfamily II)
MSKIDAKLDKVTVIDGVDLYIFTDEEAKHQDTITVIVQDRRALLIDTGFPGYSRRVKAELEGQRIEPKIIVLSHYHADHAGGCPVFPGCDIYVSEYYEPSYNNCRIFEPQYTFIPPTQLIREGDELAFGDFKLKFLHSPGHSQCSIITQVTGSIFHVGDLIMMTKDKKASLPFISDGGNFAEHIKSLERVKKLDPGIIVVPHGGMVDKKEDIKKMVDDRVYYLEKTSSSYGTLPLPACLRGDISDYDYLEFHDTNLMRLLQ